MLDFEGPSSPRAASGAAYVLDYLCVLTRGVLYEPVRDLGHRQVRRAFTRVVCRAGVLPRLMGHDRGPEIWNSLMRELFALLDLQTRPGSPYRPVEQAPVEREHVEFRRLEGAFLHDVFKAYPTEWDEMLPFAELCRNNTEAKSNL